MQQLLLVLLLVIPLFQIATCKLPTLPSSSSSLKNSSSLNSKHKVTLKGGDEKQLSSMTSSIFNLVNNVAGAGILTLSGGMAKGTGWIPALAITSLVGLVSSHTFILIGKACEISNTDSFKSLWSFALSDKSTWIVDSTIAIMCASASVIYSGILGDVFSTFVTKYSRSQLIIMITCVVLFPLGMIDNLSGLAFTSLLGFLSIVYTVIFLVIRALDGSYSPGTGRFAALTTVSTNFHSSSTLSFASLILVSNLSLAYIAHYNSPSFYRELDHKSKYPQMVHTSFVILIALYSLAMFGGYFTFGNTCQGNILMNYASQDLLSTCARLATGLSILFGYPLLFKGVRDSTCGVIGSLGWKDIPKVPLVTSLFMVITFIAVKVQDIQVIVGLTGALLGSFVCFICPPVLYILAVGKTLGYDSLEYQKSRKNAALIPFGLFVGILGAYMTLIS